MAFKEFNRNNFIRQTMHSSIEERPVKLEDMTDLTEPLNFSEYLDNKKIWLADEANREYQKVLDRYIMRRWVFTATGYQDCTSGSITNSEIDDYLNEDGWDTTPGMAVSGGYCIMPGPVTNPVFLQSLDVQELGHGNCRVTATWKRIGAWERKEIEEN